MVNQNPSVQEIFDSSPAPSTDVWTGRWFVFRDTETWIPPLTSWLKPRLAAECVDYLRSNDFRKSSWNALDFDLILNNYLSFDKADHIEDLANCIIYATIRTYHGCRTSDAGSYFNDGIRVHDRDELAGQLERLVNSCEELSYLKDDIEYHIEKIENEIDKGRLFVVVDDHYLVKQAPHYMIYGSEWIAAVLGEGGREVLKKKGAPTLIYVDLPLNFIDITQRKWLADTLIDNWLFFLHAPRDWYRPLDHTFSLNKSIPAKFIVDHNHPIELGDPQWAVPLYRPTVTTCSLCAVP